MISILQQPPDRAPAFYRDGVRITCLSDRVAEDLQIRCVIQYRTSTGAVWQTLGTQQKNRFDFDISQELQSRLSHSFLTGATTGLSNAGTSCAFEWQAVLQEVYSDSGLAVFGDSATVGPKKIYNTARQFAEDDDLTEYIMDGTEGGRKFLSLTPSRMLTTGQVQLDFIATASALLKYQLVWPFSGAVQTSAPLVATNDRGVATFTASAPGERWNVWIEVAGRPSEVKTVEHIQDCDEAVTLAFLSSLGGIDRLVWKPDTVVGRKRSRSTFDKLTSSGLLRDQGRTSFDVASYGTLFMTGHASDSIKELASEMLDSYRVWLQAQGEWLQVTPNDGDSITFDPRKVDELQLGINFGHRKYTPR